MSPASWLALCGVCLLGHTRWKSALWMAGLHGAVQVQVQVQSGASVTPWMRVLLGLREHGSDHGQACAGCQNGAAFGRVLCACMYACAGTCQAVAACLQTGDS